MNLVILESPFSSETEEGIEENLRYARACMKDCLLRNEAPFASHLLYTQPGILDDTIPEERVLGMNAGFLWGKYATKTVVYTNLGITRGMNVGIKDANDNGRLVEFRTIKYQR